MAEDLLAAYAADLDRTLTREEIWQAAFQSELGSDEFDRLDHALIAGLPGQITIRGYLDAAARSDLSHRELEWAALVIEDAGGAWAPCANIWAMIAQLRGGAK